MTWCPLLCYPLSPSPVNIERFFKLGAKFCRKKFSSQALNCFLRLVHAASSFATGQKELMFQRKKSQCLRMKIWMISTLASLLPLHPPRQVQGLPVWKFQKQGARGFGECCSGLSLQVFGVVSRFGVVWIYHWQLSLFRVLNTRCLPPIELPTSGNMTAPVQITQLSTRLPSPSLPVLSGKEKHK